MARSQRRFLLQVSLFPCLLADTNICCKNKNKNKKNCPSLQVVIATSSLSELDMDAFYWYYNLLLPRTTYLLYAYSKVRLSLVPSARLSHSPLSLANHMYEKTKTIKPVHTSRTPFSLRTPSASVFVLLYRVKQVN